MLTRNRRPSVKRNSMSENIITGNSVSAKTQLAKKRPALTNLTNQNNASRNAFGIKILSKPMVPCGAKIAKTKKNVTSDASICCISENSLPASMQVKLSPVVSCKDVSLCPSDSGSASFDESMSTCDSLKSPEFEYVDNDDASAVNFIERKTCDNLNISDNFGVPGDLGKRCIVGEIETIDNIVNLDDNIMDPQFCAAIACDIYENLRASEPKKRPSTDYMERIQNDINASMRAILIDWLVEVSQEYRLVPETLFLTVNYIDRYLSGNTIDRKRLQLLGVACMMIAAKYEEICAPKVEEFCYITDHTYSKEEVLEMESDVLNCLKFEMTAPTANCFLRRFVRAAQGEEEVPSMQLECLACCLAELSLLEYTMLCYAPSLIAASATFLAKFILIPSERPWTLTLSHHTLYKPLDLSDCVKALHRLYCNSDKSSLPAIPEKYSQHIYKSVAKKKCPPVPEEFYHELSK